MSVVDVLWGQRIKLIQVVSTSEFHEYWWNDLDLNFLVHEGFCRASEASNIDCLKIKVGKVWTKYLYSSLKNTYVFWCPNIQTMWIFWPLKLNVKTLWPQKISIDKILSNTMITLILMIKKAPNFLQV